jgi:hypothetical protein
MFPTNDISVANESKAKCGSHSLFYCLQNADTKLVPATVDFTTTQLPASNYTNCTSRTSTGKGKNSVCTSATKTPPHYTMNNDHRISLLKKYDTLLIAGVSRKEAAQQVGYSLRSFQEWRIKFQYGKKTSQSICRKSLT